MQSAHAQHPALAPAWGAAAAAAVGFALLAAMPLTTRAPEGVAELVWLAGWGCLAVAIAVGAVGAVLLRRGAGRPAWSIALLSAALLLVLTAAWLQPLFGSGGAQG